MEIALIFQKIFRSAASAKAVQSESIAGGWALTRIISPGFRGVGKARE